MKIIHDIIGNHINLFINDYIPDHSFRLLLRILSNIKMVN
jgi:hypothetical protein